MTLPTLQTPPLDSTAHKNVSQKRAGVFVIVCVVFVCAVAGLSFFLQELKQRTLLNSQASESNTIPDRQMVSTLGVDITQSNQFYDVQQPSELLAGKEFTQTAGETFIPPNPGNGKTSFRVLMFVPHNFFAERGLPNISDEEIRSRIRPQLSEVVSRLEIAAGADYQIEPEIFVYRHAQTLNQLLGPSPHNWENLFNQADTAYNQMETLNTTKRILLVFGGGGYANASIKVGDFGFSEAYGYQVLGCTARCDLNGFKYTLAHEIGHAMGIPWHSPQYVAPRPRGSIMGGELYTNAWVLADHTGYPERYIACVTSFNRAPHSCEAVQPPNRPAIEVATTVELRCQNPTYSVLAHPQSQVYFTENTLGLSGRVNKASVLVTPVPGVNGQPNRAMATLLTQAAGWGRGYAFKLADTFPSPPPDFNDFHDTPLLYFNPQLRQWCDEVTGQSCVSPSQLEMFVNERFCVSPTPGPTAGVTPTPMRTPTPTPSLLPTPSATPTAIFPPYGLPPVLSQIDLWHFINNSTGVYLNLNSNTVTYHTGGWLETRFRNGSGNFTFTPGWTPTVVVKVDGVERARVTLPENTPKLLFPYSDLTKPYFVEAPTALHSHEFSYFVILKKTVMTPTGSVTYTCKPDGTMWQNPAGQLNQLVQINGVNCTNIPERNITMVR